jgi:hypothetical protein
MCKKGEYMQNEELILLEDKLDHCRQNLEFVSKRLMEVKEKGFPKNKYTALDIVLYWTSDYNYETCEIREIALHSDEPRYYVRRRESTLTGKYNYISEFWTKESNLYENITELKTYLKNRIDNLVK